MDDGCEMEENEDIPVAKLKVGVEECLRNAERLLTDAEKLYQRGGSRMTCFALAEFSIEELAKASMLNDYVVIERDMPQKEWKSMTAGRGAHKKKLHYLQQREVKAITFVVPKYENVVEKVARQSNYACTALFLNSLADGSLDLRLRAMYVDYKKGEWRTPLNPLIEGIKDIYIGNGRFGTGERLELNDMICDVEMNRARCLLSSLRSDIPKKSS